MSSSSRQKERELREELDFYLNLRTRELIDAGIDPSEARRRAIEAFGDPDEILAECLRIDGDRHRLDDTLNWARASMASVSRDLQFAVRTLRTSPLFLLIAVSTLALGIGANTAIFSVVNGVLLQPLGFEKPGELVYLWHRPLDDPTGKQSNAVTPGNLNDWRRESRSFSAMAGYSRTARSLTGAGEPEQITGIVTLGSIFDVLKARPLIGRTFTAEEDEPGGHPVVVLSYGLWSRISNRDRQAIGRSVTLNGVSHTVVGVMPPDFRFPDSDAEFWIPGLWSVEFRGNRTEYFLAGIARLAPGATISVAEQDMASVMAQLREKYPEANGNVGVSVVPMREQFVSGVETRLLILMGAVAVVLLIACANIANLLLARATRRQREMALRQALGAGRMRLMRQVLTESAAIGGLGGIAGLAVGVMFLRAIVTFVPGNLPRLEEVGIDPWVLAFTFGVSLVAALLSGTLPALRSSSRPPGEILQMTERTTRRDGGVRGALVVSEIALAMILLAGAGLLVRSYLLLQRVDPGFPSHNLLTLQLSLPSRDYDENARARFFADVENAVSNLPGVSTAAFTSNLPVTGRGTGAWLNFMDRPLPAGETPPITVYRVVTPDYFRTIGTPLIRGRFLTDDDGQDGTPSVVINQAAALQFWPDEDPIGRQVTLGPDGGWIPPSTIVGIVQNVHNLGLGQESPPIVYMPDALTPWRSFLTLVARTDVPPATVLGAVRRIIRERDPNLPITNVATMDEIIARSVVTERSAMMLLGLFSTVAIAMAAVGVFGVMSYTVGQRTRELGIRMALGAQSSRIRWMVMSGGMAKTLLGIVLGTAGALGATRLMSSMLYEISAIDPLTYGAMGAILAAVSLLAAYLPARRATRVDPIQVLRYD
jgi:putative ABC transport system permease protein